MDLKFTKPTDSEEKIELESSLISASWRCGKAILPKPNTGWKKACGCKAQSAGLIR